jgi:hypothetical protein
LTFPLQDCFNEYSFNAVTEQMNINISALVLESDGTEVDDDELLKRFGEDHIYMALSEGQNWSAAHSVAHDKSRQEAEVIEETKTSTFNENVETGKKHTFFRLCSLQGNINMSM